MNLEILSIPGAVTRRLKVSIYATPPERCHIIRNVLQIRPFNPDTIYGKQSFVDAIVLLTLHSLRQLYGGVKSRDIQSSTYPRVKRNKSDLRFRFLHARMPTTVRIILHRFLNIRCPQMSNTSYEPIQQLATSCQFHFDTSQIIGSKITCWKLSDSQANLLRNKAGSFMVVNQRSSPSWLCHNH